MIKYEYMIIYQYPNGIGRGFVTRNKKIKAIEDVENVDDFLRSDKYEADLDDFLKSKMFVTDFKLLRTYILK